MWLTKQERITLTVLGTLALFALCVIAWQNKRPWLVIKASSATVEQSSRWDASLSDARQVDINTATVSELERLPQIGHALALRIVEYRNAHGSFADAKELSSVQGIGPKKLSVLQDYVVAK